MAIMASPSPIRLCARRLECQKTSLSPTHRVRRRQKGASPCLLYYRQKTKEAWEMGLGPVLYVHTSEGLQSTRAGSAEATLDMNVTHWAFHAHLRITARQR